MAEKPSGNGHGTDMTSLEDELKSLRRSRDAHKVLLGIAAAVNTVSNLDRLFDSIHIALGTVLDTTYFSIALYDQTDDTATFPLVSDPLNRNYPAQKSISRAASLAGEVIRQKMVVRGSTQDALKGPSPGTGAATEGFFAKNWLGVPLLARGEIIGVMAVQNASEHRRYDATDQGLMTAAADLLASAIDRRRTEQKLRENEEKLNIYANQMEQFASSAASMLSLKDEKVMYARISRAIVEYSDFRRVLISLFKEEPPFRELIGHGGVSEELVEKIRRIPLSKSWYDKVFSQGHHLGQLSYYIPHTMKHILNQEATIYGEGPPPEDSDGWHPEDNLFVRMNDQHGTFIGVISVDDSKSGKRPSLETIRPLEIYAGLISQIIMLKKEQATREALEEQLRMAQKMESVGRLAGGVAHDFNNMLGVILGHTELAEEQIDPTHPLAGDLHEIRKAAQRSAGLTRQLLAFARKQTITPRIINLNESIEGMLQMLRRLIGETIQMIWRPGANLWPVNVDPTQIDQILANLCVNARDAISGGGTIAVETANSTYALDNCGEDRGRVSGDYVRLTLDDDGHGMNADSLRHMFEPFYTTKGVGEGTGLGLATVYGAVKQNHGFIHVISEEGRGTSFTIYLPRHREIPGQVQRQSPPLPDERGQERILLVEDEQPILTMTTRILERLGYTVLAANTPEEAIGLVDACNGRIDLLLTDVIMPQMNGSELAKRIFPKQPGMRCLFMSGYTADIIARHGMLDDGMFLLEKPFSKAEIAAAIRKVLR